MAVKNVEYMHVRRPQHLQKETAKQDKTKKQKKVSEK